MAEQVAPESIQSTKMESTQAEFVDSSSAGSNKVVLAEPLKGHTFTPGVTLNNRYVLEKSLGHGGMGEVYLGRDTVLDRSVAVKVIRPRDPRLRERSLYATNLRESFAEEARIGANLTHPAIATVFDFGFHEEKPFIVFEYIPGETLREALQRRIRLPLEEARLIIGSLAQALDFAHSHHVVHRDLKPENIRATAEGHFKILDLGLAREFRQELDWSFAGTPAYASPEQADGLPCDGRTDQYALALIAHEMLTGHRLFEDADSRELLRMQREQEPLSPQRFVSDLPDSVCTALLRALMKEPNQRFASCEQFAVALGCPLLNSPIPLPQFRQLAEVTHMRGDWRSQRFKILSRPDISLVMTDETLWAAHRGEFRCWPLSAMTDARRNWWGKELHLRFQRNNQVVFQAFYFSKRKVCRQWCELLQELKNRSATAPGPTAWTGTEPDPVVLMNRPPQMRYQVLGPLESQEANPRLAEACLQIKAAMMGADAVVDLQKERLPQMGRTVHRRSGVAIKAVDTAGRRELRSRWFATQVAQLNRWMLGLIVTSFLVNWILSSVTTLGSAVGIGIPLSPDETVIQQLATVSLFVGLLHVWPLTITLLTRWLLWPQLLKPTGLAILALGGRSLVVLPACLAVAVIQGRWGAGLLSSLMVLDPGNLTILFFAVFLCRKAWRAYGDYHQLAPDAEQQTPRNRKVGGRLALLTSVLYLILLSGFQGWSSYALVSNFAFPGNESWKRNQAVKDFTDAVARMAQDPQAAEAAFLRIEPLWQELVGSTPQQPEDRQNLAATHHNLGVIRMRLGKVAEAQASFREALTQYDKLEASFPMYQKHKSGREAIRQMLTQPALFSDVEKRGQAAKQFIDAAARVNQDPQAAEAAFLRLVPLWQELALSTPPQPGDRMILAGIHQNLGITRMRLGKTAEAEASLRQALAQYEELEAKFPTYLQHKPHCESTRQTLAQLLAFKPIVELAAETHRLQAAGEYQAVIELFRQKLTRLEQQKEEFADQTNFRQLMAYMQNGLAWQLANSPDKQLRDPKQAVDLAQKAVENSPTEGNLWNTLGAAHVRAENWNEGVIALEKSMQLRQGGDGFDWLFLAMAYHQLGKADDAKMWLSKSVTWISEREQSKDSATQATWQLLRAEAELIRQEAEELIGVKREGEK